MAKLLAESNGATVPPPNPSLANGIVKTEPQSSIRNISGKTLPPFGKHVHGERPPEKGVLKGHGDSKESGHGHGHGAEKGGGHGAGKGIMGGRVGHPINGMAV